MHIVRLLTNSARVYLAALVDTCIVRLLANSARVYLAISLYYFSFINIWHGSCTAEWCLVCVTDGCWCYWWRACMCLVLFLLQTKKVSLRSLHPVREAGLRLLGWQRASLSLFRWGQKFVVLVPAKHLWWDFFFYPRPVGEFIPMKNSSPLEYVISRRKSNLIVSNHVNWVNKI
jgi:hypothetical protein